MFVQVLVICLLSTFRLTAAADNVASDIVMPRSLSLDAYIKKLDSLWTTDQIKKAKPIDIVLPNSIGRSVLSNNTPLTGPPSSVPGSLPLNNNPSSKAISSNGQQVRTTGRVFWTVRTSSYSCSASVITSKSTDLIATAAHCVYDTDSKTWYNNNNWVFIPAYSNGYKPYGTWPARRFMLRTSWMTGNDYNADVAFVALQTVSQRHIQAVVGSQGISFNAARLAYTYSFGYPANLDNGEYLKSCAGNVSRSSYTQNQYAGQALPCTMGHGCSGGPWLQNFVESTGIGFVTAVNSFMIANVPNVMNGPYFDSNIKSLYDNSTIM